MRSYAKTLAAQALLPVTQARNLRRHSGVHSQTRSFDNTHQKQSPACSPISHLPDPEYILSHESSIRSDLKGLLLTIRCTYAYLLK